MSNKLYYVYVLSKSKDGNKYVWEMVQDDDMPLGSVEFTKKDINNPIDLVLVKQHETDITFGELSDEYRVYAVVDKKLVELK
jgi:hypothetical protein